MSGDGTWSVVPPTAIREHAAVQLDISAQAKGVYHVELVDERRRYTGKVVFE